MTKPDVFQIPDTIIQIVAPRKDLDFFDKQTIQLTKNISPLEAWRIAMETPMPFLKVAFQIRDVISGLFGVSKIGGFSGHVPKSITVGQMLDFFLVEANSQDALTLTSRDKHLDVMTCVTTGNCELSITSSVKTHNAFGRIYMLPVAPFHKSLVRRNLRHVQQYLD